jgi:hypothetical protein
MPIQMLFERKFCIVFKNFASEINNTTGIFESLLVYFSRRAKLRVNMEATSSINFTYVQEQKILMTLLFLFFSYIACQILGMFNVWPWTLKY